MFHVEHFKLLFSLECSMWNIQTIKLYADTKNMHRLFILTTMFLFLASCKSREAHPEFIDPIYQDILKQLETARKETDTTSKELAAAQKEMSLAQPQTGEAKVRKQQIDDAVYKLEKARQKEKYLEIHLESRKQADQKSYNVAFEKDLPWPDPEEYRMYMAHERLENSPRSWDEHLREILPQKPTEKPKPKAPPAHE